MEEGGYRHVRYRLLKASVCGLAVIAFAGSASIGGLATVAYASTRAPAAYGPPPPPAAPPPPGFTGVSTSVTTGPGGGLIGPVGVGSAGATVRVPPGAFPEPVQVTVTAGSPALLAPAVFAGFTLVSAVGVRVTLNGSPYPGAFLRPLVLTIRNAAVTSSSVVTTWNGAALTVNPAATTAPGVAAVSFDNDPDFVVLSPSAAAAKSVPSATVPVTGKPLLGEGILAGALLVTGLAGLAVSRRRKARG